MDQHCPDFVLTIQPEHKVTFSNLPNSDKTLVKHVFASKLIARIFLQTGSCSDNSWHQNLPTASSSGQTNFVDCSHIHVTSDVAGPDCQTSFVDLQDCSHIHVISDVAGPD